MSHHVRTIARAHTQTDASREPVSPSVAVALLLLPPAAGAILCTPLRGRAGTAAALLGILALAASLAGAITLPDPVPGGDAWYWSARWIRTEGIEIPFSLTLDPLSVPMARWVALVTFLVGVFSHAYLAPEDGRGRYYAYLNLFSTLMLLLVVSGNLGALFVGWEGVGLCSFLLIGFRFREPFRTAAAAKALLINRVGDACFLLGLACLLQTYGTLDLDSLRRAASLAPPSAAAGLLLCVGVAARSAQVPLHLWLPDTMAGPTPASALIHTATTVAAGIYLLARVPFLLVHPLPDLLAAVGSVTALLGAAAALRQIDIKRLLAYSTVSQLGLMVLSIGASGGGADASLRHLSTHAFFKALLFLVAGAVLHSLGPMGDMRRMGGLARPMPVLAALAAVGAASLAGVWPLPGATSMEGIFVSCLHAVDGGARPVLCGGAFLATSFMTAWYSLRWFLWVFMGDRRDDQHPHSPGPLLLVPMAILAAGSALLDCGPLAGRLIPRMPGDAHPPLPLLLASQGVAAVGFLAAWFTRDPRGAAEPGSPTPGDRILSRFIVRPAGQVATLVWACIDRLLIDTGIAGLTAIVSGTARRIAGIGEGRLGAYAVWMLGTAALAASLWTFLARDSG